MESYDGVWISISGFSDLLVGAVAKARIRCQFFTVWWTPRRSCSTGSRWPTWTINFQFSISIFNPTVTDVNDQEISTEMSFSRPIYPHGLCIILKLNKTVDGSRIQNLVIHLRKFPEENDTTIDSLDLFFKDSTTEMKYTVSPFCTQGGAVQTSKLKVRISTNLATKGKANSQKPWFPQLFWFLTCWQWIWNEKFCLCIIKFTSSADIAGIEWGCLWLSTQATTLSFRVATIQLR